MKKNAIDIFLSFFFLLAIGGCVKDDKFTSSIFVDPAGLNPASPTYNFDVWLNQNFLEPYNLSFKYKMEDVGSDLEYNLVPASLEKSKQLAQLIKYLWFDVYSSMVNEEFLKSYGPRIIHLIGSPAYNPNSGTIILGTAEGGIKVTLYNCNSLDYTDPTMLNEYYFKTMHHEFAHILHQTKSYPKDFEKISAGNYSPMGWQYLTDQDAAKLGFVSPYSASQAREDFVEVIANYLVKSDNDWNSLQEMAGNSGSAIIIKKLSICSTWLKEKWGIDIVKMRNEIITREQNINADFFNKEL
jgi:substrate import-associated zinc metallohydrolase lipoprotein